MTTPARTFLLLGSINALIGVILGAFGAHALKLSMAPDLLTVYHTAVQYQFLHALGLVSVGLVTHHFPSNGLIKAAGWFMFAGIIIFSGSLYTLSLTATRWLGAVTPIGGASFIVAWVLLIVAFTRKP